MCGVWRKKPELKNVFFVTRVKNKYVYVCAAQLNPNLELRLICFDDNNVTTTCSQEMNEDHSELSRRATKSLLDWMRFFQACHVCWVADSRVIILHALLLSTELKCIFTYFYERFLKFTQI